jgi:hypothetical protein
MLSTLAKRVFRQTGFYLTRASNPVVYFHSNHYLRHNARRLEHLGSLQIPVSGMSVLEVGAGIGDHSHYYLDRGCRMTITEARPENVRYLRKRYPACRIQALDMEHPTPVEGGPFDVLHCYGLLYHLNDPGRALEFLGQSTRKLLFLETCVSFGDVVEAVNPTKEPRYSPTQAYSGMGCRPTRAWLFHRLETLFKHVYVPKAQPWHEEFPVDWTAPEKHKAPLQRAIFIGSKEPLENCQLVPSLIAHQERHE